MAYKHQKPNPSAMMDGYAAQFRAEQQATPPSAEKYAALFAADYGAFHRLLAELWQARDLEAILETGEVLRRHGELNRKYAPRYCAALLWAERFQDALDLLTAPATADPQSALHHWQMTRALAGVGRTAEAMDAAQRALALGPELQPAGLLQTLAEHEPLQARLDELSAWAPFARLIELKLRLGQKREPAQLLILAAERGAPASAQDRAGFFALVQRLAPWIAPQDLPRFVRSLRPLAQTAPALEEIDAVLSLLGAADRDAPPAHVEGPSPDDAGLLRSLALACAAGGRRKAALSRLCAWSPPRRTPEADVLAMARIVGEQILAETPLRLKPHGGQRRIINLTPFNNERLMLRIKLREMAPWVDHFVIVEAAETFTGRPKPLYFSQWKDEFADLEPKITHVVIDAFPSCISAAWAREFYQRDLPALALADLAGPEDLVLITDTDEVVRRAAIESFEGELARLHVDTFRYFLNHRQVVGEGRQKHYGSVVKARYLQRYGASYCRSQLARTDANAFIADAGWHFTSIADPEGIVDKVTSYSHQEHAHRDASYFHAMLEQIRHGGGEPGWARCEIDESFPAYIRDHQGELEARIL